MKINVTPQHQIELTEEYAEIVRHPRREDYAIHTILRKNDPTGEPLIETQLTIAGQKTRKQFPATNEYPVHFVKRYSLTSYHSDPEIEYRNGLEIQKFLDISRPLGADAKTFRNCFLPGIGLNKLSPFGVEPLYRNIDIAEEQEPKELQRLWSYLEKAFQQITILHEHGWVHEDMELHNIIVMPKTKSVYLIDLESALPRDQVEDWEAACLQDKINILREAIYIQCALGKKQTALGKASRSLLEQIFPDPEEFVDYL